MKNKFFIGILLSLLISIFVCSCGDVYNKFMCGEPQGRKKEFIDSVNIAWEGKLVLKQVPCYNDYIEVSLKTKLDSIELDNIENEYRRTVQWAELLVRDKSGKLIRGSTGSM